MQKMGSEPFIRFDANTNVKCEHYKLLPWKLLDKTQIYTQMLRVNKVLQSRFHWPYTDHASGAPPGMRDGP